MSFLISKEKQKRNEQEEVPISSCKRYNNPTSLFHMHNMPEIGKVHNFFQELVGSLYDSSRFTSWPSVSGS